MLTVSEASARILERVAPLPAERVPLLDALGRVLASDIVAAITLPPWDNSAMDGYAVRGDEVAGATADRPVELPVAATVIAGAFPASPLAPGTAVRVMTGAPVPDGTDSVVRVEDTDGGETRVRIRDPRDAGKNVRPRGEDFHAGSVLLARGTPLGPAQLGVLASTGGAAVDVHRRPRVAILGSGDELVDLDGFGEVLAGRRIVSSNSYTLHAAVRAAGGDPVNLGIARDDPADLRDRLLRAAGSDLLITTAGVSVGALDYTRDVLADLGAAMSFWRVRMRPGAPIGFGVLGGDGSGGAWTRPIPWIGLPGNPVSTMVTFELFARPAIRRLLGHDRLFRRPVAVRLAEEARIAGNLLHFLRAVVTVGDDGALTARLTGPQGSGILTSMARANALLVVPPERPVVGAGESVQAILLGDEAVMTPRLEL